MTPQERGDLLLAQHKLLWWMPEAERERMLDQIDAEYSADSTFEEQMKAVTREMECVA